MISYIFNLFEQWAAHFKRAERLRIKRLETDLAQAKLVLSFYARADNYPSFTVRGQQHVVLSDRGARARQVLRSMPLGRAVKAPMSLVEAQHAANTDMSDATSWAIYRDDKGVVQQERREIAPA